jgi:hypothetical protein
VWRIHLQAAPPRKPDPPVNHQDVKTQPRRAASIAATSIFFIIIIA